MFERQQICYLVCFEKLHVTYKKSWRTQRRALKDALFFGRRSLNIRKMTALWCFWTRVVLPTICPEHMVMLQKAVVGFTTGEQRAERMWWGLYWEMFCSWSAFLKQLSTPLFLTLGWSKIFFQNYCHKALLSWIKQAFTKVRTWYALKMVEHTLLYLPQYSHGSQSYRAQMDSKALRRRIGGLI